MKRNENEGTVPPGTVLDGSVFEKKVLLELMGISLQMLGMPLIIFWHLRISWGHQELCKNPMTSVYSKSGKCKGFLYVAKWWFSSM